MKKENQIPKLNFSCLKKNFLLLIVFFIALVIFSTNLAGQDYSFDEPETILIAKSIATNILPSPWDGKNLISINNGLDYSVINNKYIWTWHPWLQHYVTYVSQLILPPDTIRLAFALFGVATVIILFLTAQEIFQSKIISFFLSIQLIFLLPFFLYIRQVRYYSLAAFFSTLLFFLMVKQLKDKWSRGFTFIFAVSSLLLFFSNYIVWLSTITLLLGIFLYKKNAKIIYIIITEIIFALFWFAIFKPVNQNPFQFFSDLKSFPISFLKYISYINNYISPTFLIILFFILKIKKNMFLTLVFLWILVKLIFYSIFLIPHGRYLVDIFPILILSFGWIYVRLLHKNLLIFLTLFCIITFTNILNSIPQIFFFKNYKPKLWLTEYKVELTQKYNGVFKELGKLLKPDYKNGDLFWSNAYSLNIYNYSGIPSISPVCKNGKFVGPENVIDINKIKFYIFIRNDNRLPQDLKSVACFGKRYDENLKQNYKQIHFKLDNLYFVNDTDIVNRQFPPRKFDPEEIVIYTKK